MSFLCVFLFFVLFCLFFLSRPLFLQILFLSHTAIYISIRNVGTPFHCEGKCVRVVVFAVMVWHSFSWLFVILAVCWLTFIGATPIFGLQVARGGFVVFIYCDPN